MKKFLPSAVLILCCLSSCQRAFEDNAPTAAGSARVATLMSDDEWLAEGYTEEKGLSDLPGNVQGVMNTYFSRLSWLESRANFHDDETMLNFIATATFDAKVEAEGLALEGDLTAEQKTEVIATFEGTAGSIAAAYDQVLWNQSGWENTTSSFRGDNPLKGEAQINFNPNSRGRKFWRAVLRIVVAVAVTAVLIALPVAAVALIKPIAALGIAKSAVVGAAVKTALLKGVTLGSFKASAALASGLTAGIKNAEKNYHEPWQGSVEFLFGIKIAPIYH